MQGNELVHHTTFCPVPVIQTPGSFRKNRQVARLGLKRRGRLRDSDDRTSHCHDDIIECCSMTEETTEGSPLPANHPGLQFLFLG